MGTIVQIFFKNYADALLSFSAEKISDFYQTPLAIYSDKGIQIVTKMPEVIAFWKEGVKPYKDMGIYKTTPYIVSEEQLSENTFAAKVRWANYDKIGKQIAEETNFYILSQQQALKISGLIIMGK